MLRDIAANEQVKLFNTLAIETGAQCNRSCVFCPNHQTDRPDTYLSMKLIEKIVDELREIDYKGRLTTYIYNEPLRDKRLTKILELFQRSLPKACVMISTNGDYLKSKDDIEKLFALGVRQLLINIYSAGDGNKDPKKVMAGIKLAQERFYTVQRWVDALDLDQKSSVYTYVKAGSRVCKVMPKFGVSANDKSLAEYELQNRSGNIEWFQHSLEDPLEKMCVRPFRFLNIDWQGNAILCCNDYHGDTAFGNIKDKTLVELWNSEGFNKYRLFLQNKRRDISLCDKCDYGGGVYPHMVDTVTFGKEKDKELLRKG